MRWWQGITYGERSGGEPATGNVGIPVEVRCEDEVQGKNGMDQEVGGD